MSTRWSADDLARVMGEVKEKQAKYRNKRTIGGYASIKEGKRAAELKLLEKAGEITNLHEQVPFVLIPAQKDKQGRTIERAVKYYADFQFYDKWGNKVVEDVKGLRTKEYILKRKLLLFTHGIRIREV